MDEQIVAGQCQGTTAVKGFGPCNDLDAPQNYYGECKKSETKHTV